VADKLPLYDAPSAPRGGADAWDDGPSGAILSGEFFEAPPAAVPTLYAVIYADGTGAPSAAQIKLGTDAEGNPATWAGNVAAPTVTTAPFDWPSLATGLTASTGYRIAFVWSDGTSDSNVVESARFDTLGSGISGSAAQILGEFIAAAAGGVLAAGSSSAALAPATAAGSGSVSAAGASSATLGAIAGSAAATVSAAGSSAATLGTVIASGNASVGSVPAVGTQAATLGTVQSSGAAAAGVAGSAAAALGQATQAASAAVHVAGSGAAAAQPVQASGAATLAATGSGSATLGQVQATGSATVGVAPVIGSADAQLRGVVATASGVVSVSGSAAGSLGQAGAAGAGAVRVAGSSAATLGAASSAGAAAVVVRGTSAVLLARILGAGTASVSDQAPISGSGGAVLGALAAVAFGGVGPARGVESLALFFDPAFALPAVWGTLQAGVILDAPTEDVLGGRVLTDEYAATLPAASFPGIGRGAVLQIDGGSYRVREVRLLDDGALKELLLTRVAGTGPQTFGFQEDLGAFFNVPDFATLAFWRGAPARVLLDSPTEDVLGGEVLTDAYQVTMRATDWPGIVRGAEVVVGPATYVVREVRATFDGAVKTLKLRKP
jgi:hypothetical protein